MSLLQGILVALAASPQARPETADEFLRLAEVQAGLCVTLKVDGPLVAGLTNQGRMVVQALAQGDTAVAQAREAIRAAGLSGVASVDRIRSLNPLPYADNLVNLLIADLDALREQAPPPAEILRVLAPRGVALLRREGVWARTVKPRPDAMDEWSHFYHGPDANPVSRDTLVGPPTGLQWIAGVVGTGADPTTGYRLAGGRAVYEWADPSAGKSRPVASYLLCRDAFSGVALWSRANAVRPHKTRPLVLTADRVFTFLDDNAPPVALDAATGRTLFVFEQGGRGSKLKQGGRSDLNLAFHDDRLIETAGATVSVFDARDGALAWTHAEPEGAFLDLPAVSAATRQLFVTSGNGPRDVGRYVGSDAREILAFDLAAGGVKWRRAVGKELSQLCVVDGALYAFNLSGFIGRRRELYLARLRLDDGALEWQVDAGPRGQLLDFAVVGGKIYVMSLALEVYDAKTGARVGTYPMPGNSRCEMSRASTKYLLMSFGNFVDLSKDPLELRRVEISRGGCGCGNTPGYGMLYYPPNRCQCFASVRGFLATSRETVREPWTDDLRLEKGEAAAARDEALKSWPHPDEWPIYLGNLQRGSSVTSTVPADLRRLWTTSVEPRPAGDTGPVAADALLSSHRNGPITAPVVGGNLVVVGVPEDHRVDAFAAESGRRLWSYTAGARVDTPPTLYGDLCLFGSRDGWVYALQAATGRLAWRFFAAPYERRMVAHNQVESSWPLFGSVTVVGGVLVVAAGRHPETNGGIHAWGLDPHRGTVLWKQVIRHDRPPGPLGKKIPDAGVTTRPYGYNANLVLNEILVSDGALVSMTGLTLDPRSGRVVERPYPKKASERPQALPEDPMAFAFDFGFRPPYRDQQFENYGGPGADHGSWHLRLKQPALDVHGESIAFNRDRVACTRVAGIEWGLWDLSRDLPGADVPGRQNSSARPSWSASRNTFKEFFVKAALLAGDTLVLGLTGPMAPDRSTKGELRFFATKDGVEIGRVGLDAGVIQSGVAAARGRLYVSGADGTLTCLAP
jgi:outer membrane protein assembly factor BamB